MSKDVINVDGEERVVREDTAKAYRGVNWAWASIGGFILILAIVAILLMVRASRDGSMESPGRIANTNANSGR
jgi:hypothetical protein